MIHELYFDKAVILKEESCINKLCRPCLDLKATVKKTGIYNDIVVVCFFKSHFSCYVEKKKREKSPLLGLYRNLDET